MKTFKHLSFALLLIIAVSTNAQVGIGTSTPAASAALDITSTNTGLLPPRMTKIARDGIATPVAGLMIWCSNCGVSGQIQVYDGTGWTNMVGGPPAGIAVGESYGGGKVAYILQPVDPGYMGGEIHGLIAAPSDQSTGAEWGCEGELITGTYTSLGTGQGNTTAIVNGCEMADIAARICNDLVLNGYDDWYLPSQDELNKLYINKTAIGGFINNDYWSSSEFDMQFAHNQNFLNGSQSFSNKDNTSYVRAIRTF